MRAGIMIGRINGASGSTPDERENAQAVETAPQEREVRTWEVCLPMVGLRRARKLVSHPPGLYKSRMRDATYTWR
jgi:hypothetical protein